MEHLTDIIEKIIDKKLQNIRCGEIGVVTEVFPHQSAEDFANYTCHLKIKALDAYGDILELRHVPIASNHIGTVAVPNIGDMVFVQFLQGSIHQPIVTGRLYHSELRPPFCTTNEIIQQIPPGDKTAEEIVYIALRNHKDEPRQLSIRMKPDLEIELNETQCTIELQNKKTAIKMVHEEEGTIKIYSQDTQIVLEENKNITVEAPKNIVLKAKGNISLDAKNIYLNSNKDTNIQAKQKFIATGKSKVDIKSSGPIKTKGNIVDIN